MLNTLWTKVKEILPQSWKGWLGWAIVAVAITLYNRANDTNIPVPPPPSWGEVSADNYDFGWQNDQIAVAAVVQQTEFKTFADTPAGQANTAIPNNFYLWDVYKKLDARARLPRTKGRWAVVSVSAQTTQSFAHWHAALCSETTGSSSETSRKR